VLDPGDAVGRRPDLGEVFAIGLPLLVAGAADEPQASLELHEVLDGLAPGRPRDPDGGIRVVDCSSHLFPRHPVRRAPQIVQVATARSEQELAAAEQPELVVIHAHHREGALRPGRVRDRDDPVRAVHAREDVVVVAAEVGVAADHPELVTPRHGPMGVARLELVMQVRQHLRPGRAIRARPDLVRRRLVRDDIGSAREAGGLRERVPPGDHPELLGLGEPGDRHAVAPLPVGRDLGRQPLPLVGRYFLGALDPPGRIE
jgi:hypothetical protein